MRQSIRRSVSMPVNGNTPTFDQQIQKLFANGEQGFFYDPNDLSTMFQDAVGTVPVTGVGQPVGLMLDKSKGLSLSPHSLQPVLSLGGSGVAEIRPDNTFYIMRGGAGDTGAVNIPTSPNKWYKLVIEILSGNSISIRTGLGTSVLILQPSHGKLSLYVNMVSFDYLRFVNATDNQASVFKIHSLDELKGNHTYQSTSAARPILQDSPRRIDFDAVDDKLITNLPVQLSGCTVIRSVPNVGTQILTGQAIPAIHEDNTSHCGLIVINRALTPSETSAITSEFNKRAGV